ncbi:MAG: OmpH family outer membrane protein [Prevotella sp.]|jgi:outer membrane protein|nr:OmpH family outer membrane protein [Prevotella sp.]
MKRFLFLLLTVFTLSASAQTTEPVLKFGFLSYDTIIQSMDDYAFVESGMQALQEQYAAEQKRVEDEFNKKYEEFLDGQRDFPQTILQKRQMELQELMEKNIAFKKESQRLLAEAREKAMQPLKSRLADALARVGSSRGLAFIINTDQNALPWMNITMGEDVTEAVLEALK